MSWPWSQLGLPGPSDLSEVRHAYAEKLKTTHPEDDPAGFQRLHAAYQLASRIARQQKRPKRSFPQAEDDSRSRFIMREDDIMEIEVPQEDPPQKEQEFDFEELLQGGGEGPRRPQEEREEEQDFDFEALLERDGPPPSRRPKQQEEKRDFDFEALLRKTQPPPGPREEERDFDFERLFAEGDAERAEARRRRAEERRKAQRRWKAQEQARERERRKAQEWTQKREQWQRPEERDIYEQERRSRFDQEQLHWQNTETILHTVEMLYSSGASEEGWRKFFQSALFQQNKGSLDLVFGLEDFVTAHPGLSGEVKLALFLAYGFDKGPVRPELHTLHQMLLPVWQAEEREKRRKKLYKLGTCIGGLLLAPIALLLLASGWFLVVLALLGACFLVLPKLLLTREDRDGKRRLNLQLIWLLAMGVFSVVCLDRGWGLKIPLAVLTVGLVYWVVRNVIRQGRQDERSGGRPRDRRDERWITAITAVCLAAGLSMLLMPEFREGLSRFSLAEDPREQVCHYLELDYGVSVQSIYNQTQQELYANVFAPADDVGRMFLAGPDGRRVVREGQLGYTTNYPDMMVLWALQEFAEEHGLSELETMNQNQGLERWETCGVYLIVLPFYGAGEVITALGEELERLAQEDWYQFQPPSFKVVLCSEQMAEGRLILLEHQSGEAFDAEGLRALYEEAFAQSCCAQVIRECQLDRDFTAGDGGEPYTLVNGGMAELLGMDCCRLYGVDREGRVAMEYYIDVSTDTVSNLYCVPGGFWEAGGEADQLRFSRLIRREAGLGWISLYCPWP